MLRYLEAEDADIAVLSETKVNDVPMHPALTKIYKHQYWAIGKQKGYAGLAILSKIQPIKAIYGLPSLKDQDTKGRIGRSILCTTLFAAASSSLTLSHSFLLVLSISVTLEFENSFLVGTYAVNAGEGLKVRRRPFDFLRLLPPLSLSLFRAALFFFFPKISSATSQAGRSCVRPTQ